MREVNIHTQSTVFVTTIVGIMTIESQYLLQLYSNVGIVGIVRYYKVL